MRQRKWTEAEAKYRECLEAREQILGRNHTLTAVSMHQVGTLCWRKGNFQEAIDILRDAVQVFKEIDAEGKDPATLARSIFLLSFFLKTQSEEGRSQDDDGRQVVVVLLKESRDLRAEALGLIKSRNDLKVNRLENEDDWNLLVPFEYR